MKVGNVVATERRPSTPHTFHFWCAADAPVGVGTIVRVERDSVSGHGGTRANRGSGDARTSGRANTVPGAHTIYGVVTDAERWTERVPPPDGSAPGDTPADEREVRVYTAQVLRHVPDEPLQPVPAGAVFLATDADVALALRMESYLRPERATAIPLGVYRAGGTESPVHLDADFLLGGEAAHLNITGVSGLATKTSAVEWLLASLFAHFPSHKGSIAAVCFNVKGSDLCFLDHPGPITPEDNALYTRLGVPARPFQHVEYFAPYTAAGWSLATARSNAALQANLRPLAWGLAEVLEYAEVLLTSDDIDAKADALIDFIREQVAGRRFTDPALQAPHTVRTFADLDAWFRDVLRSLESTNRESWRTHHVATIRKVRNRLTNIATRCRGLVTDDDASSDLPWGSFADRTVYVIDVAMQDEDAQDLIFARVVSELREHLERRALGVDHVVVFVDELNKYASFDGPETYVRSMLIDIAERGRYLGLVLFGAQQFRSQIHRRVIGNCGTMLFGRMDADELATVGYATLSPAIRTRLSTLDKGQLMVRHPHFAQPVFVRFPRPAVMNGRDGLEQFPPMEPVSLDEAVTRSLRRLDPSITLQFVQESTVSQEEEDVIRARNATLRARPADVRAYFRSQFRRPAATLSAADRPAPLRPTPADDPYGV
jgi:hypothetical protein